MNKSPEKTKHHIGSFAKGMSFGLIAFLSIWVVTLSAPMAYICAQMLIPSKDPFIPYVIIFLFAFPAATGFTLTSVAGFIMFIYAISNLLRKKAN